MIGTKPHRWLDGRGAGGFSLREMFIVMVTLAVVLVVLTKDFGGSSDARSLAACAKNLQQIYLACNIYQNDNHGNFPTLPAAKTSAQPLSQLIPKSTTVTAMFICPGSGDAALPEAEPFASRKISYAYYMGRTQKDPAGEALVTDAQVDVAPKEAGQQIFSADGKNPGANHGRVGGNIVSCGGEVTASPPKAAVDFRFPPQVRLLNPE